ncbi:MAG: GAF and ANTAR domain-containing protein [Nocardioides sp.]
MSRTATLASALSEAASALVGDPDVTDILHRIVNDCEDVLDADAVAILVRDASGELSLLSATTHEAADLELLQIQRSSGPCVEVLSSGEALAVSGSAQLAERWQEVGRAIAEAGFESVEAFPLRWRGTVLGGLNVFRAAAPQAPMRALTGQAFADIATLAVVYSLPLSADYASKRLHEALNARELVEQAKGVLAFVEGVDMSEAYGRLIRRAEASGQTLTNEAAAVIDGQHRTPGS